MLSSLSPPWVLVLEADASQATNALWAVERRSHVRVAFVRGKKMATIDGLFDQFAAALQFPYYFGENWPAFDECLADLDWIEADALAVVVLDSEAMLPRDADFETFVRVVQRVASEWAVADEFRPARPFHVVLHVPPEKASVLTSRLTRAGVQYARFDPGAAGDAT